MDLKRIEKYLHRLPKKDQHIYDLYCIKKIPQKEIAKVCGLTQGAISSRMKRLCERVQYMETLDSYDIKNIKEDLSLYFDEFTIQLLISMAETTCQSETARRLNFYYSNKMNQVKVRHRFEKSLIRLKELSDNNPELSKYYSFVSFIKKNLYVLHEVRLPQHHRSPV